MATKDKATAPQADGKTSEPQGTTNVTEIERAAEARLRDQIEARHREIKARFRPFLDREDVRAMYDDVLADTSVTVEAASQKLLAKLGEGVEPLTPQGYSPRIEAGEDDMDKRRKGVTAALMVRAGVATPEIRASVDGGNPYRGMRLLDLARASLERAGVNPKGMSQMEVVAAAFTQSTSDFPILLEDAMHKTMLQAYQTAPDTWSRFCALGSVSDFRPHHRYRSASIGNMQVVNENGEFKNVPIKDGEKASIQADTKGLIVNMSRQMVINDDLGAFIGMAANIGRSARRTVEAAVYALLGENSGLGPTQADGEPLFHANRNNVASSAVNSTESWDAMRVLMAQQKDVGGNDYLDIRPSIWLGPIGLGGAARNVNEAEYNDEATKNQRRPNISRGLVSDIVDTPRLTGNRFYLFANPSEAPVIEVAFLDGQIEPYLERMEGFTVDGSMFKGRHDFGVAAVDYRGAITNAGG